jgi:hypothetical protein
MAIKKIVLSAGCVTTIGHENPGKNQIFVTADASDQRSGAILKTMFQPARINSNGNSRERTLPAKENFVGHSVGRLLSHVLQK